MKRVFKIKLKPTQIMVLGFALVICVGAILLSLPIASNDNKSVGIINAFFTATSAVCVTGLVVKDTATQWTPFGQTTILLLIQIGGLGFMTIGTIFALVIGKKISFRERMIMQESLNQNKLSGIVKLTKNILFLTFGFELVGAFILSFRFVPLLGFWKGIGYSIFHSVSAFCNAGFDLMGTVTGKFSSFTGFDNDLIINMTFMILIICGGLGFTVIMEVAKKKRFKKLSLHSKLVLTVTAALLLIGFLSIFTLEFNNPNTIGNYSFDKKILPSMFQAVTPRTAGFNTLDYTKLTTATIFLTIMLMFIGGSSGSTAGGVKTSTFGVVFLMIRSVLRGEEDANAFTRKIPFGIIRKSIAIVGLALGLVVMMTMALSISDPTFHLREILFEVVSAFGTVGLSLGITPALSSAGKVIIALTMFFGRVGPLTIFLAISHKKLYHTIKYPEEQLIVG